MGNNEGESIRGNIKAAIAATQNKRKLRRKKEEHLAFCVCSACSASAGRHDELCVLLSLMGNNEGERIRGNL